MTLPEKYPACVLSVSSFQKMFAPLDMFIKKTRKPWKTVENYNKEKDTENDQEKVLQKKVQHFFQLNDNFKTLF